MRTTLSLFMVLAVCTACTPDHDEPAEPTPTDQTAETDLPPAGAADTPQAEAVATPEPHDAAALATVMPTEGNAVTGTVRMRETSDGVVVETELSGLPPGSTHGMHIHETGDCSASDGTSAGGHYNPEGVQHGLPSVDEPRHAGDLGNVTADAEGRVSSSQTFEGFSLDGTDAVVGRAVILHAERDTGAQPSGGAGDRIGCGVIQAS
ncbi:MAG: superoxide dismutase family protein [Sandaracinaceae bacterium]